MTVTLWRVLKSVVVIIAGGAALIRLSFAYIDPNTGGMLFQFLMVVFSLLTGILLFFSRYIRMSIARIKRILRGSSANDKDLPSGALSEE